MPKFAATLFVIYSLFIALTATPAGAQPQTRSDETGVSEHVKSGTPSVPTSGKTVTGKKKPDLKKVFDEESKRFKTDTANFDPVKIEREKAKQAQNSKWGTKQTVFIVVFAAAVAVLVWFVAKYYKECLETSSPNCTPAVDEGCYCERYAEDNKK